MNSAENVVLFPTAPRPVSLPMYTLSGMEETVQSWWLGLARHLREAGVGRVPDKLESPEDLSAHWLDKDLLFSQTCGYPLTHSLDNKVRLIATPIYNAPGCVGMMYRSNIIVRDDLNVSSLQDLRYCDVAINGWDSQSGFNALRACFKNLVEPGERFFARTLVTHGHARSIAAVKAGEAQCAAIDAVTFALLQRHNSKQVSGLHSLAQSDLVPGLPYITQRNVSDAELDAIRTGLFAALADPDLADVRTEMLLSGAEIVDRDAYDAIDEMEVACRHVIL